MQKTRSLAEEYHLLKYLFWGIQDMLKSPSSLWYLLIVAFFIIQHIYLDVSLMSTILLILILTLCWALYKSCFFNNIKVRKQLEKIHFCNHEKEYPYLISLFIDNDNHFVANFKSEGKPLDDWLEKQSELENVLNITIFEINMGERKDIIEISYIIGLFDFKVIRKWRDSLIDFSNEYITIGQNGIGLVQFSFLDVPHILIGGSSGSGKTILIKIILHQCLRHKYQVILIDFKGAVDYTKSWRKRCEIITDMEVFYAKLIELHAILNERMEILAESDYCSIEEYNCDNSNHKLQRLVIAIDEFADILETASDKDCRVRQQQMIDIISKIVRKGRAAGIHLIISTQRPDAVVLPSNIKCNMMYRVAGRCDDNLSRIILDKPDAATKIPTNTRGVFLDNEGRLFKAFYATDSELYN